MTASILAVAERTLEGGRRAWSEPFGLSCCYGHLKARLRAGEALSTDELDFIGAYSERRSTGGWHSASSSLPFDELPELPTEDSAMLAALMDRPEITNQGQLEFLG